MRSRSTSSSSRTRSGCSTSCSSIATRRRGRSCALDYDGPDRDGRVTTLLDGASTGGGRDTIDGLAGAFRLTPDDIREVADALDPGTSAGFIIFEHLWARGLKQAIDETDGVPFAEGFLTPEAVAAIAG